MTTPVIGNCGHTFELNSINENSKCPLDGEEIQIENLIPHDKITHDKIRRAIELMNEISDAPGVFIYLSNPTLEKITSIVSELGILKAKGKYKLHFSGRVVFDNEQLTRMLNTSEEFIQRISFWSQ